MKFLQIKEGYTVWYPSVMKFLLQVLCLGKYQSKKVNEILNRSYISMYIEWWLHNIGYYITIPFCKIHWVKKLNDRFKDVDIEELK